MTILVVEDDRTLRAQLRDILSPTGRIQQAAHCVDARYACETTEIALVVLDLGLPDGDGFELIEHWRKGKYTFPILVLTARDQWQQKVHALEMGADDYVVKPFQPEELMARVNALLRRSVGVVSNRLVVGPLALDLSEQQAYCNDVLIELTDFEYRIFSWMIRHPNRVATKSILMDELYPDAADPDSNTVEVFIRRLRKKIDPDGSIKPIETLRGRGYRLNVKWAR